MKFLTYIDVTQNEIRNAVIQNLGTNPGSPLTGQLYTNTAVAGAAVLKFYNGTSWITFSAGTGTVTSVTAGDSSITVGGTAADPTVIVATGGITNTHIAAGAAIAYSKLNLATSIVNADINTGAAIAYSKLNLSASIVNADIASGAALAYSKLNLSASIVNADIASGASIAFAKLASPIGSFDFNNQRLTSLGTPTAASDGVTKAYVDSLLQGLSPKAAVLAASTTNVNISSAPSTLDGVTLTTNCRVLLKDQTTAADNGIYVFTAASSALTRALDMDIWAEVPSAFCWVEQGTDNADTAWVVTSDPGGTLATTAITWSKFSTATTLGATAPIVITSNSIVLNFAARLVNSGGNLDLASSIVTPGTYSSVTVDTYGRVTVGADLITSNGLAARTSAGTFTARTITGTTNQVTVTNGDGVSGNPTLSLPAGARGSLNATGFYNAAGSGTASTFTITQATHGLGSSGNSFCDIIAACYDISANPAVAVVADISINTSTGDVTFTFASSQTLTNFRFTLVGK